MRVTRRHFFFSFFFLFLFALIFSSCALEKAQTLSSQNSGGNNSQGTTTSEIVGNDITPLSLNNSSVTVPLEGGKEAILLVVSADPLSSVQSFQLTTPQNPKTLTKFLSADTEEDTEEDLHMLLRNLESEIPEGTPLAESQTKFLTRYLKIGDSRDFKVIKSFTSKDEYTVVTATLVYEHEDFEVFLDSRDLQRLSSSEIQEIFDNFAQVLPKEFEFFGEPSDIDKNSKFTVLLTQEVNKMGELYNALVTGWFFGIDLFASQVYPASNGMEIFYGMVPDPNGEVGPATHDLIMKENIIPSYLVHELQHLISFGQHVIKNKTMSEANWLNEDISHLIEDIHPPRTDSEEIYSENYMVETGLENPSRVSTFLADIDRVCFLGCSAGLQERGGGYLFLRYAYEMIEFGILENLEEFLQRLLDGKQIGLNNLKYALFGDESADQALSDLVGLFALTIYFAGSDELSDPLFSIKGINLRGASSDNRGTMLNGPAVISATQFPLTGILEGFSMAYVKVSGQDIANQGGELTLEVSDSKRFKAYLIQ